MQAAGLSLHFPPAWILWPGRQVILKKIIGFALFLQVFLFQIFIVTKAPILYGILRAVFFAFCALLLYALGRRLKKEPVLVLFLILIVLIRVPFYLHSNGLVTTSDNAHEGLQIMEIRDAHTVPTFFLGALKHIGTIKYLWAAFIADLGGTSYFFYVLLQAAVFIGFLFALEALLRGRLSRTASYLVLFFAQFALAELIFDYSLSIRGAPYLEMILFSTVGFGLIDLSFRDAPASVIGAALMFFSIYIHPLSSVLAGSAAAAVGLFALFRKRILPAGLMLTGGVLAGLWHWFYFLLFTAQRASEGSWEQVGLVPLSGINPSYFALFFKNVAETFRNLFHFEYSYLGPLYLSGTTRTVLDALNTAVVWLALAALLYSIFLFGRKVIRLIARKDALDDADGLAFFFLILLGAVLVKTFLFFPAHTEPRHNFDWMYLLILAIAVAAGAWIGKRSWVSFRSVAFILAAIVLTVPHYEAYRRSVVRKEASYNEILPLLQKSGVRALATDFIIAYPIYYLSGRRIEVSDTIGPLTIKLFYKDMRDRVDALPAGRKAYLFFSESYPSRSWHRETTRLIREETEAGLAAAGIHYVIKDTPDFSVIIPDAARAAPVGVVTGLR